MQSIDSRRTHWATRRTVQMISVPAEYGRRQAASTRICASAKCVTACDRSDQTFTVTHVASEPPVRALCFCMVVQYQVRHLPQLSGYILRGSFNAARHNYSCFPSHSHHGTVGKTVYTRTTGGCTEPNSATMSRIPAP